MQPVIYMEHIKKVYRVGQEDLWALRDVSFSVDPGEYVAIMGPSGSGKSTTMHIIGCLDVATEGIYRLDGVDVASLIDDELAHLRNQKVGFVFQSFNLLPRTTAVENVELPLLYAGVPPRVRREWAIEALIRVGLGHRLYHHSNELSGGQQQRVAIARALVGNPSLILADEPTGALDSHSSEEILGIFAELNQEGRTVVMVTHEPDVAHHAKRIISFRDGMVVSDTLSPVTEGRR
ncbi:probable ABC transporter ATP-binding protein [Sulfobacillus acidophilus TPY]|uniref:Phosphonate-transporting ATPase n=1 Tax=Sulfobacillus acidophilus (strain ATCC 700253 / DSM 10332 / NAL) TaxID=679936 RepID=G8TU51_SULAD|nr:probable ABC transporter ATP-binding protein [Sulfobacillus acidophilus TPY]AEW05723.1 Phosphonate-transporting ATPase [Sulfobacillus acidophilus DSM 10332]